MMPTEELAEIRARHVVKPGHPANFCASDCSVCCDGHVPWLLELVDKQQKEINIGAMKFRFVVAGLQERVRALEAKLEAADNQESIQRGIADSEAGKVTPWSGNAP